MEPLNWEETIKKSLPEGVTLDAAAMDAIVGAVTIENQGLVNKRNELLGSLTAAKKHNIEIQTKLSEFDNVDLVDYNKIKENVARGNMLKDGNSEEYINLKLEHDKLKLINGELNTSLEKSNENYKGIQSKFLDTQISNELNKAFDLHNVSQAAKPILLDAFRSKAEGVLDGDNTRVVMRDGESQLSVNDFMESWSKTDNAKAFISANVNGGGNANGSSGTNGSTQKFSQMTLDERTVLFKTNPSLYNQLKTT